jgi:hypothetical protein
MTQVLKMIVFPLFVITFLGCKKETGFQECAMFSSFSPKKATVGDPVTLKGVRMNLTLAVEFNDSPADSFKIINDSTLIAYVGANTPLFKPTPTPTTGITVITAKCSSGLSDFTFYK